MKKLTIEQIRQELEKEGYTLLSTEYRNNKQKLRYKCPEGHFGTVRYCNWKSLGARCKKCANIQTGNRGRTPLEEVKKEFENRGYTLLSTEYKNQAQKLKYRCPKNHTGYISFSAFKQGQGCKICGVAKSAAKRRLSFDSVKEYVESRGYTLLSDEYINTETKLKLLCEKGHVWHVTYHNFKTGHHSCGLCCENNKKYKYSDVKAVFEAENYQLVSQEYLNNKQKLDVICPEGHEWVVSLHDFNSGYRCSQCSLTGKSKAELELFEFIKENFPNAKNGDKSIISPFELDIVIPEKKTAIEYCGLYWHSELNGKTRSYHQDKLEKCTKAGYKLITVFEDEWIFNPNIVKSRLLNILGVSHNKRIYARQCEIKEIDTKTKNAFLNKNHLQGADSSSIKLGAFYQDELVSVMTFSKGSISKGATSKEGSWELSRFCSDYNLSVVGIASKLFKHFVRNYKPKEIYTYGDLRWSTGGLYKKLGFTFKHKSKPSYWYLINNKRLHRFNFRKNVLKDKLDSFDPNLTEWQNMAKNGYNRIWDCGNVKWEINFSNH